MRFSVLCSGSKGNCFLLMDEHTNILIDCGSTQKQIKAGLEENGVHMEDLDAILITHTHWDHVAQLKMFKDYPLYAYASLEFPHTHIQPGEAFQVEHLTITPLEMSHDAPNTIGFVIENHQEKLVYITDTGYVKYEYVPKLKGADYIILESNHDVAMLMETNRPYALKQRIASDEGHLCNEDCAALLQQIVTTNTKQIVLAHLSRESNTRFMALNCTKEALEQVKGQCRPGLIVAAAGQFELIKGGDYEKVDMGSVSFTVGMEHLSHVPATAGETTESTRANGK